MGPEKRGVSRRKVNKRTFKQEPTGQKVAKGFWVSFKVAIKTCLVALLIAVCIVGGLLVGVVAGCIITTEPLTEKDWDIKSSTALTSFIYDSQGNELVSIQGTANENRQLADIEEIPDYFAKAFVAIEDERFYSHNGVDVKRTVAAFLGYVVPSMGSHGGSTITQQVVKNLTGDDARSVPRKIREQWRAMSLEKELDKEEILELYMNIIFMGQNVYGVKAAALAYFDKDVSDLSLAECAFLAGITNNPAKYNPFTVKGRTNCYKRQINILDKMLECEFITEEEYIEAIQEKLVINEDYRQEVVEASIYSYFVDAVLVDAREALVEAGYTNQQAKDLIYQGGVKIYTTQDPDIQKIVDEEYCNISNFPVNHLYSDPDDMAQSSIVIMDQATGHVKAMYGGFGEKKQSLSFNFATSALRQPGSAIKPILVYGPLVDQHVINLTSTVDDLPVFLDKQNPEELWPMNHEKNFNGRITVRYALQQSINIAAVALYKDHVSANLQYLKKLGIDRTSETHLSLALGGFTNGVTTEQMCAAYVPFANGGTYYKPITFTHIEDINGNTILTNTGSPTVVYDDYRTSAIMTDLLQSVVTGGTGRRTQIYNAKGEFIPTAGKTGTTTSSYDLWYCGYTPYYTCAVWYGYEMQKTTTAAESIAHVSLWAKVMNRIHAELPAKSFEQPSNVVNVQVCKHSNMLPTEACRKDPRGSCIITGTFAVGTEPTEYCNFHRTVVLCSAGKDPMGKNYIAGPYCTEATKYEYTGTYRNVSKETYDAILKGHYVSDWKYEISHADETCPYCKP